MITRVQLLSLGFSDAAIKHRLACGRLRRIHPGIYAVGQLALTQEGDWTAAVLACGPTAAVLACGPTAALSHDSAAALWKLTKTTAGPIHVSVLNASRTSALAAHRSG